MENLAPDWHSLLILTFVLGMKHGFDADHLATIDGLTRYNARHRPGLARYCGALFSLGHGAVVMLIAAGLAILAGDWEVPAWFGMTGAVISIGFLLALGIINLRAVLSVSPQAIFQPVGLKGRCLGRLGRSSQPVVVASIGALFALSFDTLSQAVFFALSSNALGWPYALLLAGLFTAGMLLTDAINGLWIARLIARADGVALIASRVLGVAVSTLSLLVAALGIAKLCLPAVDAWSEGKELMFGALLIGLVGLSFFAALRLGRRHAAQ